MAYLKILLILTFSTSLLAQDKFDNLNMRMHKFVDDKDLAGVQTLVIKDNKILNFDTYGYSNIKEQKPLTKNSIFRIASMTKCIVSVAFMKLYDQGHFNLEDPINKYIPEFSNTLVDDGKGNYAEVSKPIRIVDLLRHTSGYGKSNPLITSKFNHLKSFKSVDLKTEVERMSKIPLSSEPGTEWRYSPSVNICGYLIELISEKKLDEFLKDEIFDPLNMTDTFFEIPESKFDRFTTLYIKDKENNIVEFDHPNDSSFTKEVTFFNAAGLMASTIKDFSQFCEMMLNKGELNGVQILKPKTVLLMTEDRLNGIPNAKPSNANHKPNASVGFGLGFNVITDIQKYPIEGSLGSYGWHGSNGTYFKIDPKENLMLIFMTQMKGFEYSQKEIFESMVYKAVL